MDAFKANMVMLGSSTEKWRRDVQRGVVSYGDSIADVLLRLRLAMREGELILDRVTALAAEALPGEREIEGLAVKCARNIIEPFRDAVLKAQDIADRKDMSDLQKQAKIFRLAVKLSALRAFSWAGRMASVFCGLLLSVLSL